MTCVTPPLGWSTVSGERWGPAHTGQVIGLASGWDMRGAYAVRAFGHTPSGSPAEGGVYPAGMSVRRGGPGRAWALAVVLVACGDPSPELDGGPDAPGLDAPRPPDAGPPDAGPPLSACDRDAGAPRLDAGADPGPLDPGSYPPARGPGGPNVTFTEDQLLVRCGTMNFGPSDQLHHNTGFFLDGYLVRAYAHEHGGGGIVVLEMDDPCNPVIVANVTDPQIRETHATGYSTVNGRWIAVASLTGIQFWDVSDVLAPVMVTDMTLPGTSYPDAYMRTVMSISWQAPYVYVGGSDNGVYVVDATDPRAPVLIDQFSTEPLFRVGNVHAVGNLLVVMGSENARAALYDISVPDAPRPFPGGTFLVYASLDRFGRPVPSVNYFGMFSGGLTYHARNGTGSGLAIFDVRQPTAPRFLSGIDAEGSAGGYVFLHEGRAFVGLSNYGLIYDVTDPTTPVVDGRIDFPGDLDTMTPLGNVVMVSVDDDSVDGTPTGIFPWATAPDTRGPRVDWVSPDDGADRQSLLARVGLTFDEFVAMESVWEGSIVVREVGTTRALPGWFSGQEGMVSFWPLSPFTPGTEYEIVVPAGGVHDISGNALTEPFRATFTTATCE